MKALLSYAVLFSLVSTIPAQQATSPQPVVRTIPAPSVTESEATKAPIPSGQPPATAGSFNDRLRKLISQATSQPDNQTSEKSFENNYRIKVDYLVNGKTSSFSIVTAHPTFSYQGARKEALEGLALPSTMTFEGQLSNETDSSIYLTYFLGQSIPYATKAPAVGGDMSHSTIQQIPVGIKNGAIFHFGEALKVVESGGDEFTITISRIEK